MQSWPKLYEAGDTRATGLISGDMNPAAVPVQHDIPCSNLIFSLDWLYSAHIIGK